MRAAVLYEYDQDVNVQLKLEDVPEPTVNAADEVIVRVGAAGLCRTDLHIVEGVWRDAMDPAGVLRRTPAGSKKSGVVSGPSSGEML